MRSSLGVSTLILFFITVTEVPAIFTDADARIKGAQIGDHERDVNCITRICKPNSIIQILG